MKDTLARWFDRLRTVAVRLRRRLAAVLPGLWRDLHLYGGLGLAAYGLWLWWPPAAYIGPGLIAFGIGVVGLPSWSEGEGS